MNINLKCTDLLTPLSGCDDVLFPVFWGDEAADLVSRKQCFPQIL